jgi:aryl carrier-like protein
MDHLRAVITDIFRARPIMTHLGVDDDYFDSGVSSLTIIGLQLEVERALGVTIETGELMRFSTINEWIDAYSSKSLVANAKGCVGGGR